jgi:hypothetical protein
MRSFQVALCASAVVVALDNGLGVAPPRGWRSWNLYGANVNQDLIEGIMKGMTSRKRMVDGKPTSLQDLGYVTVGLDDNWQLCGDYAPHGYTYHNASGDPVVNTQRFPNMKQMTDYAHSLGLLAGWYGNNVSQTWRARESCHSMRYGLALYHSHRLLLSALCHWRAPLPLLPAVHLLR